VMTEPPTGDPEPAQQISEFAGDGGEGRGD
jgi:hypothetical protein